MQILGLGNQLDVLPAGGTNLEELRREMRGAGMSCIAIVDGDTEPNERGGKYALKRDCVELYAPQALLQSLFGTVPPLEDKKEFFHGIQQHRQVSENGIKAAISEHIRYYLSASSPFVMEVRDILQQALGAL